jgi:hypothetical protein
MRHRKRRRILRALRRWLKVLARGQGGGEVLAC